MGLLPDPVARTEAVLLTIDEFGFISNLFAGLQQAWLGMAGLCDDDVVFLEKGEAVDFVAKLATNSQEVRIRVGLG
ncbi:hypothetical protein AC579_2647 [Pseudocercospora musae]|uniref:Uncharacterized protein n=1 Tax=Pseudocercospora musae TaxID=113226 RepID=A0A139IGZ1_9PEZI|nr:hypothetical protein AC579_2647 [Pseudocercospora musae]